MTRLQRILSGLLVVQVALVAAVFWPRTAVNAAGAALFPDLKSEDVVRFLVEDSDGNQIELARQGDGWVLASADDYPADASRIDPLLEKIVGIKTNRLVAQTEASHKRLKVADDAFESRVQLVLDDGSTRTFFLGSSPNIHSVHIRRAGLDETYLTSDIKGRKISAQVHNWIDTLYISVPRDEVTAMTLENGSGTFALTKDADGNWSLAGMSEEEEIAISRVNTLLSRIGTMRLAKPLGKEMKPEYGLDNPQAKLSVFTSGENGDKTYTLLVGVQDPDDHSYVVKWSDSPYYVRVAGFYGDDITLTTRDDLIQQLPTPTPISEDTGTPTPTPTPEA